MDSADRLIEYYFQRKIAGMPSDDIHQSLKQQMMEEDDRNVIVSQVEYRELRYLKALRNKKTAKILLLVSVLLLLSSGAMLIYSILSHNDIIRPIVMYLTFCLGAFSGVISFFLFPKRDVASFKS